MPYRLPALPASWLTALGTQTKQSYFQALLAFLEEESKEHDIYPPPGEVYNALELTPLSCVRVLLLGQDPYPGAGQAHGLAFSVKPGLKPPASLKNMYRELESDLGVPPAAHGTLTAWAEHGVLMLNAVLTVRGGKPNSHHGVGWERFTDEIIRCVNAQETTTVFALWGKYAQKKIPLIDQSRHAVVTAAHPSPLSAHNGFFGSHPFSRINAALDAAGRSPIDWTLPPAS